MSLLYENDFTVSKGAFVISNTGGINQGWITDPTLNTPDTGIVDTSSSILSFVSNDIVNELNTTLNNISETDIDNVIENEDLSLLNSTNVEIYTDIIYDALINLSNPSFETTNFDIKTNSIDVEMNNFIGTYIDPIDNLYMNNADINNIIVIFENDAGSDYEKMVPTVNINNIEYFSTFSKNSTSTSSLAYLKIRRTLAFSEMVHISYEADTTYYPSANGTITMVIYDKSQYLNDSTIDSAGEILGKRTIKVNIIDKPEVAGTFIVDPSYIINQTIYIDKPNIPFTENSTSIYLPYEYDPNMYKLEPFSFESSFAINVPYNFGIDIDKIYANMLGVIYLDITNNPISDVNTLITNGSMTFNFMVKNLSDGDGLDYIYKITFEER